MKKKKTDKTSKNGQFSTVEDQLKAFAQIIVERILDDQQNEKIVKE